MARELSAAGPVTAAGQWLIEHQGLVNIGRWDGSMRGDEIDLRAAVVAIEAEAAEQADQETTMQRWEDDMFSPRGTDR